MPNDPIPSPDPGDLEDDPLNEQNNNIFARRELLRIGHVPESDRIVGRSDEIEAVEALLRPSVHGAPPGNGVVYGKTGSGKSLVARHVTGRARALAQGNAISFFSAYVDCEQSDTLTRAARSLAQQVAQQSSRNVSIPDTGIGSSEYMTYLYDLIEDAGVFVAIIDEIDKLDGDDVLFKLSRAEESGKTSCYIGVLAISNKIEYYDRLGERVKSSFQDEELVFHPYDADQLRDILRKRRDAFVPGVLDGGVIPKVAALAAQEHGDARKAIDILSSSGEIASRNGDVSVTEGHVEIAQEYAAVSRVQEIVSGSTPQSRYALFALAYLDGTDSAGGFSTGEIYRVYEQICRTEGMNVLSRQRVLQLLKEWAFNDITENRYTGGGMAKGSYREHTLMHDAQMVLDNVFRDDRKKHDIIKNLRD